MALSTEK